MKQENKNLVIYGTREAIDEEKRTVRFVISDETKDRHGTVIKLSGWELENYNRNPIVAYGHMVNSGDANNIIGKGNVFVEENKLMGLVEFEPKEINELAEKIYQKILFGSLNATSVGFMPKKGHWGNKEQGEDENTYYFEKSELFEFSVVDLPSNPSATVQKNFEAPKKDRMTNEGDDKDLLLQSRKRILNYLKIKK